MSKSAAWRTLELRRMNRTDEAKQIQDVMDTLKVWVRNPTGHLDYSRLQTTPRAVVREARHAANQLIRFLILIHDDLSSQIMVLTDKMDAEETGAEELS